MFQKWTVLSLACAILATTCSAEDVTCSSPESADIPGSNVLLQRKTSQASNTLVEAAENDETLKMEEIAEKIAEKMAEKMADKMMQRMEHTLGQHGMVGPSSGLATPLPEHSPALAALFMNAQKLANRSEDVPPQCRNHPTSKAMLAGVSKVMSHGSSEKVAAVQKKAVTCSHSEVTLTSWTKDAFTETCCPAESKDCAGCARYENGACAACAGGYMARHGSCEACADSVGWQSPSGASCEEISPEECSDEPSQGQSSNQACCMCAGGHMSATPFKYEDKLFSLGSVIKLSPLPRTSSQYSLNQDCELVKYNLTMDGSTGEIKSIPGKDAPLEAFSFSCEVTAHQGQAELTVEVLVSADYVNYGSRILVISSAGETFSPAKADGQWSRFGVACAPDASWLSIDSSTGALTASSSPSGAVSEVDGGTYVQAGGSICSVTAWQKRGDTNGSKRTVSFVALKPAVWDSLSYQTSAVSAVLGEEFPAMKPQSSSVHGTVHPSNYGVACDTSDDSVKFVFDELLHVGLVNGHQVLQVQPDGTLSIAPEESMARLFDSLSGSGKDRQKIVLSCGIWGTFASSSFATLKADMEITIKDNVCWVEQKFQGASTVDPYASSAVQCRMRCRLSNACSHFAWEDGSCKRFRVDPKVTLARAKTTAVADTREGCPPSGHDFMSKTITTPVGGGYVFASATMMAKMTTSSAAAELYLNVDGKTVRISLKDALTGDLKTSVVSWAGYLEEGTHTISLSSPSAGVWGCGDYPTNSLNVLELPSVPGVMVLDAPDIRPGCPSIAAADTALVSETITIEDGAGYVFISFSDRRASQGMKDLNLYVDGSVVSSSTSNSEANEATGNLFWAGYLAKGSHIIDVRAPDADTWGCDGNYGGLSIIQMPDAPGIEASSTPDLREGCPATAEANAVLLSKTVQMGSGGGYAFVGATMKRLASGQTEFSLRVDGATVLTSQAYTTANEWTSGHLSWAGKLSEGYHSIEVVSGQANIWGCKASGGSLNVLKWDKDQTANAKITDCLDLSTCLKVEHSKYLLAGEYCPLGYDLQHGGVVYRKSGSTPADTMYLSVAGDSGHCASGEWLFQRPSLRDFMDLKLGYFDLKGSKELCLPGGSVPSEKDDGSSLDWASKHCPTPELPEAGEDALHPFVFDDPGTRQPDDFWLHPCECASPSWGTNAPVNPEVFEAIPAGSANEFMPESFTIVAGQFVCPCSQLLSGDDSIHFESEAEAMEVGDCESRCRDQDDCNFYWHGSSHGAKTCRLYSGCDSLVREFGLSGDLKALPREKSCHVADPDRCWSSTMRRQFLTTVGQNPSSSTSKAAEVVRLNMTAGTIKDTRAGCPGSAAANTPLISQPIEIPSGGGYVWIGTNMIRYASGRVDLHLYVDGELKRQALPYTSSSQWEHANLMWAGELSEGTHTIEVKSPSASVWGCGETWGAISHFVLPKGLPGVEASTVNDARDGCPASAAANSVLLSKTITVEGRVGYVLITAQLIRYSSGRADLHLYLDGSVVGQDLLYTSGSQWQDGYLMWAGHLSEGTHTIEVKSPSASVWGCTATWGGMNVVQLPDLPGVSAMQVVDTRPGCPGSAAAGTPLISKKITMGSGGGYAWIGGSMIRYSNGRADIQLMVDGAMVSQVLTYTGSTQWEHAKIFWAGHLDEGEHEIVLQSPTASVWGCEGEWGSLNILQYDIPSLQALQTSAGPTALLSAQSSTTQDSGFRYLDLHEQCDTQLLLGGMGVERCSRPTFRKVDSHVWKGKAPLPSVLSHGSELKLSCWQERFVPFSQGARVDFEFLHCNNGNWYNKDDKPALAEFSCEACVELAASGYGDYEKRNEQELYYINRMTLSVFTELGQVAEHGNAAAGAAYCLERSSKEDSSDMVVKAHDGECGAEFLLQTVRNSGIENRQMKVLLAENQCLVGRTDDAGDSVPGYASCNPNDAKQLISPSEVPTLMWDLHVQADKNKASDLHVPYSSSCGSHGALSKISFAQMFAGTSDNFHKSSCSFAPVIKFGDLISTEIRGTKTSTWTSWNVLLADNPVECPLGEALTAMKVDTDSLFKYECSRIGGIGAVVPAFSAQVKVNSFGAGRADWEPALKMLPIDCGMDGLLSGFHFEFSEGGKWARISYNCAKAGGAPTVVKAKGLLPGSLLHGEGKFCPSGHSNDRISYTSEDTQTESLHFASDGRWCRESLCSTARGALTPNGLSLGGFDVIAMSDFAGSFESLGVPNADTGPKDLASLLKTLPKPPKRPAQPPQPKLQSFKAVQPTYAEECLNYQDLWKSVTETYPNDEDEAVTETSPLEADEGTKGAELPDYHPCEVAKSAGGIFGQIGKGDGSTAPENMMYKDWNKCMQGDIDRDLVSANNDMSEVVFGILNDLGGEGLDAACSVIPDVEIAALGFGIALNPSEMCDQIGTLAKATSTLYHEIRFPTMAHDIEVEGYNACNPMQVGMARMFCDVHCVRDAVIRGDRTIIRNLEKATKLSNENMKKMVEWSTEATRTETEYLDQKIDHSLAVNQAFLTGIYQNTAPASAATMLQAARDSSQTMLSELSDFALSSSFGSLSRRSASDALEDFAQGAQLLQGPAPNSTSLNAVLGQLAALRDTLHSSSGDLSKSKVVARQLAHESQGLQQQARKQLQVLGVYRTHSQASQKMVKNWRSRTEEHSLLLSMDHVWWQIRGHLDEYLDTAQDEVKHFQASIATMADYQHCSAGFSDLMSSYATSMSVLEKSHRKLRKTWATTSNLLGELSSIIVDGDAFGTFVKDQGCDSQLAMQTMKQARLAVAGMRMLQHRFQTAGLGEADTTTLTQSTERLKEAYNASRTSCQKK